LQEEINFYFSILQEEINFYFSLLQEEINFYFSLLQEEINFYFSPFTKGEIKRGLSAKLTKHSIPNFCELIKL